VEVSLQSGAAADFQNLASLTAEAPATARISGAGLISLKFEQEGACWVEFTSSDLAASGASVSLTVSENKLPAPLETHAPVQHGDVWRLEPNPQLYEGSESLPPPSLPALPAFSLTRGGAGFLV